LAKHIGPDGIDEEQWLNIPILTRDKVQQEGEKLRATTLPGSHGKVKQKHTSGSTGKPIETLGTDITDFFWNVVTLRDHLWHRRDFNNKLAVIRFNLDERAKPPHGMRSKGWGLATDGVINTGSSVMLSILTPISEQVAWLQKEDPNYILTHPSVLTELALHCQQEGVQFPSLREVRTISEALPEGLRELCQRVWGVKLVDMYSTIELGYLALQCPEHYHVQSEGVFLEVLDDNGRPCAPGEIGRVIVTDLHNYAFPLIRYEVGDYAEVGEPCACGRGLPVIKHIKGRYRNILTTPSGERRFPQLGIQDLHEIAPVQQFQAVQHTLNDIEIRLVLPRPLLAEEREKLTAKFHDMMGAFFNFDIQQVGNIQRSASGKYEDFVSML
jgi:phenylacetate-CoA ligase